MFVLKQPSFDLELLPVLPGKELSLQSTLQELWLHEFSVETECPGNVVANAFQTNPLLPGVILTERGKFFGMISRRQFLEYMSRPYGLELFLKRPIESLYLLAKREALVCSGQTLIVMAARRSLQRPPEVLYEPIVVEIEANIYRLLDVHQLLVAQSHIHELASQLINQLYQQLEKANQDLQRLATADSLTKVANRRRFDEYLDLQWLQLSREPGYLSLILCDVDFFKGYNDTYGHLAGDGCLQQVAQAISNTIKKSADLVARYGGEEFAVILPNTNAAGAAAVAEQIRDSLKALQIPHHKSSVSPYVTLSLGVACMIPHLELTPDSLIEAADRALYQAKVSGRNRYVLHSS